MPAVARWILKAAAQGLISRMPRAAQINEFMQRRLTGTLQLDERTAQTKWNRVVRHIEHRAARTGRGAEGCAVLELGTGWYPVAPIALFLLGARRVITLDNVKHLDAARVRETARVLLDLLDRGRIHGALPERIARVAPLAGADGDAAELLRAIDVQVAVGDARTFGDPGGEGIDLFISNNTLEHIPPDVLSEVLQRFSRIGAPGAMMSHWIDLSDHYAHFDRSVGVYNFLAFTEPAWAWLNNDLHYQSRLRAPEYRALHQEAGWRVVKEEPISGAPEDLRAVRVAPEFQRFTEAELLVHEMWLVSERAAAD